MNSETNLEHDVAQVVSYLYFNSKTRALSQDIACDVKETPRDVLLRVLRFFLSLSFHVPELIYHRSYKIFKIDSTL
jgi:hypothetical protein